MAERSARGNEQGNENGWREGGGGDGGSRQPFSPPANFPQSGRSSVTYNSSMKKRGGGGGSYYMGPKNGRSSSPGRYQNYRNGNGGGAGGSNYYGSSKGGYDGRDHRDGRKGRNINVGPRLSGPCSTSPHDQMNGERHNYTSKPSVVPSYSNFNPLASLNEIMFPVGAFVNVKTVSGEEKTGEVLAFDAAYKFLALRLGNENEIVDKRGSRHKSSLSILSLSSIANVTKLIEMIPNPTVLPMPDLNYPQEKLEARLAERRVMLGLERKAVK